MSVAAAMFCKGPVHVDIDAERHASLAEEMHVRPDAKTFGITDNIREQSALGAPTASQGKAEDCYGNVHNIGTSLRPYSKQIP